MAQGLSNITVKKGLHWTGKKIALATAFFILSSFGYAALDFFGIKAFKYNNMLQEEGHKIATDLITSNKISKKQYNNIIKSAKDSEVHFLDYLKNKYNKEGVTAIITGLDDLYSDFKNSAAKSKEISSYGDSIATDNENKRLALDTAIEDLNKEWNENNVNNYKTALELYKSLGFNISSYEDSFGKLEERNEETLYFDKLKDNITGLVNDLVKKGYDNNTIATEIGVYFSEVIDKTKKEDPITEIDIKGKTRELSDKISSTLNYRVSLEDYL